MLNLWIKLPRPTTNTDWSSEKCHVIRDPWFILLAPVIFVETLLYKCNILILQGDVRLHLGATCCWTENEYENREQQGIV